MTEKSGDNPFRWYRDGDYSRAVPSLESLAKTGDSEAQRLLGEAYRHGNGIPIDVDLTIYWYKKSAEHNDAKAMYALAILYDPLLEMANPSIEERRPKDATMAKHYYEAAISLFRQQAEAGDAEAMHALAVCYQAGSGVVPDAAEAFKWSKAAFDNGFIFAANDLFSYHSQKDSPWYDERKAREYYKAIRGTSNQVVRDEHYEK